MCRVGHGRNHWKVRWGEHPMSWLLGRGVRCIMENEVHICLKNTARYLNHGGVWSGRRSDARKFPTTAEARSWCAEARLMNVEIVVIRDALICMRLPVE